MGLGTSASLRVCRAICFLPAGRQVVQGKWCPEQGEHGAWNKANGTLGHVGEDVPKSFDDSGCVFIRNIGQGRFGCVKAARKRTNAVVASWDHSATRDLASSVVAVRILPRTRFSGRRLLAEEMFSTKEKYKALVRQVETLRALDHPNICKVYETFEDRQHYYITMEHLTGGELLDRESDCMPEHHAAACIEQVLSAMAHSHGRGLVHRDLRPENIHYASPDADSRVVVTDWECSCLTNVFEEEGRRGIVFSDYTAPELSAEPRSDRSDVWSIGMLTCGLVRLELPLGAEDLDELHESCFPDITPECQDFLRYLLRRAPSERPSAQEALQHPWLKRASLVPGRSQPPISPSDLSARLTAFRSQGLLRRAAATLASGQLSGQRLHELSQDFLRLDANRDGTLDAVELEAALRDRLESESGMEEMAASVPSLTAALLSHAGPSGRLSYTEFLAAATAAHFQESVHLCWEAFKAFDVGGRGEIPRADLARMMSTRHLSEIVEKIRCAQSSNKELVRELHSLPESPDDVLRQFSGSDDRDKAITFEEFAQALLSGHAQENVQLLAPAEVSGQAPEGSAFEVRRRLSTGADSLPDRI